ncbi:NADP-dependent L-serine/L-allo-threonine dehydrogenase, putative [Perkinsus marinus ATCC 50983]|uniref:NADP-dependent L-serine/L-allo-threonine dehydrogenase, putative n=1 Tax=Perkinsus marinus (strain ATCC 50983 / TXsc) TaxID=423536 RepID=C5KIB7_PERM5|nr:NADP-dependent L-serine/L-allo-threonine dehydrogenase, putative [Perkinsus marinus ATCC 50983]EER15780.1 NADP-dependent L-serine/L-allo-threonine dehydrogenase, putative [Perkinsus marinus ATCC 50983]|eukprot:XP_002783984.1 NADP-dependent L-serine/L-allo-threonine dehydrogenase, putative [Perkinsus marinus ATCC 50983]
MSMQSSQYYGPISLKGERALITGATAGIGQATARRLAELGCELYLLGRRTDRLDALKEELEGRFPSVKVHSIPFDVKNSKAIEELPQKIGQPIDILVNNAGYAAGVPKAWEADVDDMRSMFEVNVIGYMAMIKAFVPGMLKAGKGHILNVSSVAGREPYTGGSIYNGTKFAVTGRQMLADAIPVTEVLDVTSTIES